MVEKKSRLFEWMLQLHGNSNKASNPVEIGLINGTISLEINPEKQNRHIPGNK